MENASFITTEDGDDLIVSFAIRSDEYGTVKSLNLLRTPKFEFALDESELGVKVSFDDVPDDENELLRQVKMEGKVVTITTNYRTYMVSMRDVADVEIEEAKKIFEKMNFDRRFKFTIA